MMDSTQSYAAMTRAEGKQPSWSVCYRAAWTAATTLLCTASWMAGRTAGPHAPGLGAWAREARAEPPAAGGQWSGELRVVARYPSAIQDACPGGLEVSSSIDSFRSTVALVQQSKHPDSWEVALRYPSSLAGTKVQLSLLQNAGRYEAAAPAACTALCPGFSTAGMQTWGPKMFAQLPADGSPASAELWPSFCQARSTSCTEELWSQAAQRPFNVTVTLPSSLVENPLPRPEGKLPSVLVRLDGQFLWPYLPNNGDASFAALSLAGAVRDLVFVTVDLAKHGDVLWRHPLLVPTSLRSCPDTSAALEAWPSLRRAWEAYQPAYQRLNSTYGFGQADALLDFITGEMLPRLVTKYLPRGPAGRALRVRDLDVGLWGASDAGYTAWYGAWSRPGDFDAALMQTPMVLWNCGEALDTVKRTGREWLRRARAGEFGSGGVPRFYMDHGEQEDPRAFAAPIESLYGVLRQSGLEDGKEVFLVRGHGDGHFDNAFYRRAFRALVALYGVEDGGLGYRPPL
uniref:Uncharacterized protein n=1 Tax=Alexandrium monilatum TaxID=311494 RepID=A0A7S4RRR5_9DINO